MSVKMLSLRETIARLKQEARTCERKAQNAAEKGLIETAEAFSTRALNHRRVAASLSIDLAGLEAEP